MVFFESNGKQIIKMATKGEIVKSKSYTRKLNLSFMIHADFKSILIQANNAKSKSKSILYK